MRRTPLVKQERREEKDYLAASDDGENQIDLLSSLPEELWYLILDYCSVEDLQQLAQTNKKFQAFITLDPEFWQYKLNTFSPPSSPPIAAPSPHAAFWRTYYLDRNTLTKRCLKLFSLAKAGKEELLEQLAHANDLCKVDHYGLTILDWLRINKHQSILDRLFKQASLGAELMWSSLCWSIICNQDEELIRVQLETSLVHASPRVDIAAQALKTAATTRQIELLIKTISAVRSLTQLSASALDGALNTSAARAEINLVNYCFSLDIQPTTFGRNSALIIAAEHGHLEVIKQLCQINDFPRPSIRELTQPLTAALTRGYISIVKYLTENNRFDRSTIIAGIKNAIATNRTEIAKYLIGLQNLPHLNKLQMNDIVLSLLSTAQRGQREVFASLCTSITHPDNRKQLINTLKLALSHAVEFNQCSIIDYICRSPASPLKLNEKLFHHNLSAALAQKKWSSFVLLYHLAKNYNPKITKDLLAPDNHLPNEIPGHVFTNLTCNAYSAELFTSVEQLANPLLGKTKLILNKQLQAYKEKLFIHRSKNDKRLQAALLQLICDIDNYQLTTVDEVTQCLVRMKNTKELSDSLTLIDELMDKIAAQTKAPVLIINRAKFLLNYYLKNAPQEKESSFFSRKHKRLNAAIAAIITDINNYKLTTAEELAQRFDEMQNKKEFKDYLTEIADIMHKIFGYTKAEEETCKSNSRDLRLIG